MGGPREGANTKEESIEIYLEISQIGRVEDNSAQDKEQEEVMKDKIPCVMELKVLRNSVSMEVGMVVTQVQEELQYQPDKEFQNVQVSEGLVSHAVDEWNVPEKDNVEPDSAK